MKKILLSLLLCLTILCACGLHQTDEGQELWIVTEKTNADWMNHQLDAVVSKFQADNSKLKLTVEILPTEEAARAEYLRQLSQKIAAGAGPDVFLLPTNHVLVLDEPQKYSYQSIQPVFEFPELAMHSGTFLDISEFYNKDTQLNKEQLNETVMNAGTLGSARYILPLRYNVPVVYVWNHYFSGEQGKVLEDGILAWMNYALESGDKDLICGAEYTSMDAFSQVFDFEKESVLLSQRDASEYLHRVQKIQEAVGEETKHRGQKWLLQSYVRGTMPETPVQVNTLGNALAYAAIAKAENIPVEMYPLRTTTGDFVANVAYYAAIGANCKSPRLAYDFIRTFLLEDYQWERTRLEIKEQYDGLIADAYPVRDKGAVADLWKNYQSQVQWSPAQATKVTTPVDDIQLSEQDLPILQIPLDAARFPLPKSMLTDIPQALNEAEADVDALSAKLLDRCTAIFH